MNQQSDIDFVPKDIKLLTELEHFEALGNNFPNGCLFRLLIDANILENEETKDVWTKHIQLLYLSPSWEQISHVSRDDMMMDFTKFWNDIHPDDQEDFFPIIYQSLVDGTLFNVELRCFYSATMMRWMQISSKPRRDGSCVVCDGFFLDITRGKLAEKKLITEKKRLEDFGNNIPNGAYFQFLVNSRTGKMTLAQLSDTWTEITGVSVLAALDDISNLFATVIPDDLPFLMEQIEKSARTLCELNCEVRVKDPKSPNKNRWIQIVSRPSLDKEYVVGDGIVFDITKHKINEIELAIHRDELELLVEKRTEELTEVNEELITTNEELSATKDDLADKNVMYQDEIVAREKIMHQLEDSETKMRNFIEQSLEGIYIFDYDGRITEWNRTMEEITGLDRKDAIGKYEWDVRWMFYPKKRRTAQALEILRFKRQMYIEDEGYQKPTVKDFTIQTCHGEIRQIHGSMFPIKMKDTCLFGRILSDVTQKWETEMELNRYRSNLEQMVNEKTYELTISKEKAEESNRLKSAFLANMSHEVRTPLNAIVGLLNILADDPKMTDDIREYIDIINNSCDQLLRMIEDILDEAKIQAGQMNIYSEPVCLNDLMNEMCIMFHQQLRTLGKSNISLKNIKKGGLDDDNAMVYTDPVRLRQIIQNLISNAIKFTDDGYIHIGYRLTKTNMLEFFVEDTGIGIPENRHEDIFLVFRQAELGNNRRYGGTGLGLTISRNLVQLMGGDMKVTSIEGKGSTFIFTIPYHPCEKV